MIRRQALSPAFRRMSFSQWLLSDWHDKALVLLLGIFLYQYVVWFDFYWLSATTNAVTLALAATLLSALLLPSLPWVQSAAAAAGTYAAAALVVRPEPVEAPEHFFGWAAAAIEYSLRLTPYLWFALGAWAVYTLAVWYVRTKGRLFFVMITSIVLFCIVDSFSPFRLWEQVAVMVGCGLLMLVIFHLKQLKASDPEGYGHLMDYPLPITVMIVTIISASLALGVLAPSIRPIIMDPYTAWKTYRGEAVPALSSGPGFAAISVGSSASGYSRNDSQLGGAFLYDYSPVFTVDTTRRSYWRGEARSLYTGNGWEMTAFFEPESLVSVAMSPDLPSEDPGGLETIEITQTIRVVEGRSFPVLFAAPYAVRVEPIEADGEPVSLARGFWDKNSQSIFWFERGGAAYPAAYRVTSRMPVIDPEKLKTAPPIEDAERFAEYLALPEDLPERVALLAAEVTAEAETPYEKAKALEFYLSTTYAYTNEPDISKRTSRDFVDSFLFEIQEGYCDYFSTAMVVMARTLGLPARWVKGYVSGMSANELIFEQFLPEEIMDPDGPGTYTVRNADAHSWAEIYFEGFGWIPFEPTAGFVLPIAEAEETLELPDLGNLPAPEAKDASAGESAPDRSAGWIIPAAAAAALVAAVLLFAAFRFQWLTFLRTRTFKKSPNYNLKLLAEVERLLIRFRRRGLTGAEHETFREMTERWMRQYSYLKQDLEALLVTFEKAKYSGTRLTEEEYRNAEMHIRKLKESI